MKKVRRGTATVISEQGNVRLIKFNGRFYTVFGRLFAVKGDQTKTDINDVVNMQRYGFNDFNNLSDMYAYED